MTDMEMAEKQIKEWDSYLYPQLYPVALVKTFIRKAFLAGLKEGRPVWHDLRKDPTDVPKAPFVFVSGTCKFSIPVDGEDTEFRGYFAGRYQTADDLGIFGGDDFEVFHGSLFDETGECCGTVKWTEQQFREYVVNMK